MTHNPTQAEVQKAYNALSKLDHGDVLDFESQHILLAAVARDTLGWRKINSKAVDRVHVRTALKMHRTAQGQVYYWIKDALNADLS